MCETRAAHGGAMCEGLRWIARWSACCIVIVAVCVVSIGAGAQEQTASPTIRIAAAQNGRVIIDRLLEDVAKMGSLGIAVTFKNADSLATLREFCRGGEGGRPGNLVGTAPMQPGLGCGMG